MSPGSCWAVVALCAAATFAARAVGPAAAGARLGPATSRVVAMLGPPLLGALVVTQAAADGTRLAIGADTAGAAVAAFLIWRKAPVLVVVIAAAAVTGLLRLAGAP